MVTGCYAQIDPQRRGRHPRRGPGLGNLDKLRLAEHLAEPAPKMRSAGRPRGSGADRGAISGAAASPSDPHPRTKPRPRGADLRCLFVSAYPEHPEFEGEFFSHFYGYTRAFLKVQTGCDSRCAYCVIPLARGPARSMPMADVLREVDLLAARGFREVVLTGINLGSWGRDTGEGSVADLLEALLDGGASGRRHQAGLGRDATRVECRQRHRPVPAQLHRAPRGRRGAYGSRSRPGRRPDGPALSSARCRAERLRPSPHGPPLLRRRVPRGRRGAGPPFPDAAIGADVIVGFPGETEAEFDETLSFIERAPLTYLHVFAYSDRPGTKASADEAQSAPGDDP